MNQCTYQRIKLAFWIMSSHFFVFLFPLSSSIPAEKGETPQGAEGRTLRLRVSEDPAECLVYQEHVSFRRIKISRTLFPFSLPWSGTSLALDSRRRGRVAVKGALCARYNYIHKIFAKEDLICAYLCVVLSQLHYWRMGQMPQRCNCGLGCVPSFSHL